MDRCESRTEITEGRGSELENRSVQIIQSEEQRKKKDSQTTKHFTGSRDMWDNKEKTNIYVVRISKEDERGNGTEKRFK